MVFAMTTPLQELRDVLTNDDPTTPRESALIEALFAVQSADSALARIKPEAMSPGTVRMLVAQARSLLAFALSAAE
jgi:hypothetical protein